MSVWKKQGFSGFDPVPYSVIGIDPSLTSLGLCALIENEVWHRSLTPGDRRGPARLEYLANEVMREVKFLRPAFVVMEGYAFGKGDRAHSLGELGGVLKRDLYQYNMEMVIVPPSTLKKFTTGAGNSGKPIMIREIFRRWGLMIDGDDEADATAAAIMGRYKRGPDVPSMTVKMREAIAAVEVIPPRVRLRVRETS